MANETTNASKLIDKRTRELGDWRGKTLSKVREVIRRADPDIIEEWKWVKATNPGGAGRRRRRRAVGAAGGVGAGLQGVRPRRPVVLRRHVRPPIPGLDPSPEAYEVSLRPLRLITDAIAECVAAGVFPPVDPAHAARVLWAASHGAVSLELAGYEGAIDPAACYQDVVAAAAASFFAPGVPARQRGAAKKTKEPKEGRA
jgi:hypothetical protein